MKSKFTLMVFCAICAFSSVLKAQENINPELDYCGHTHMLEYMEENYPGYKEAVKSTFEKGKIAGMNQRRQGTVLTIPVVFHVVWNENFPNENLDISLLEDQIAVMNEDFRRANADAGNLRPVFDDIVGDAEIEFELAGVRRLSTTKTFSMGGFLCSSLDGVDKVKKPGQGGSEAIEPEHFLNIWICKIRPCLGGQLFGYATPPADAPNWPAGNSAAYPGLDGVVCDFRTVGRNNPNTFDFPWTVVGRTMTHEVGHYLGLRHYWGDGNCGQDDGIADTPKAGSNSQTSGCNPNKNSCEASLPDDKPDMWENYMDYSVESCQIAFTNGQINLMRGILEGSRAGLLSEPVGVKLSVLKQAMSIYPNPSLGEFTISATEIPVSVNVYDLLGKNVFSSKPLELISRVDLSRAPKGVYLINVEFEAGVVSKKMLIE